MRVVLRQMERVIAAIAVVMERSWPSGVIWLSLVVIAPGTVFAQGSADLRASISRTVTLSLFPGVSHSGFELNAFEHEGELTLTVSGSEFERNFEVPILIRSNSVYKIKATVQSQSAVLTRLQVLNIEATGKAVGGDAVNGVVVTREFDGRRSHSVACEESLSTLDASVPLTILNGPRISLGGGLSSPNNALKVILFLSVQAEATHRSWTLNLKLQGEQG